MSDKPIDRDFEGTGYVAPPFTLHGLQHAVDARSHQIDPRKLLGPMFFGLELGGEAGEAQNVIKKLVREDLGIDGSRDTTEHLAQELSDTIITCCNVARYYGIDLTEAIRTTFNNTSEKRNLRVRL